MSHLITIKAKYKNVNAIKETCKKLNLGYKYLENYSDRHIKNLSVHRISFSTRLLSVCETIIITEAGDMYYDDMLEDVLYPKEFKQFKNNYCLIETKALLKKQGLRYRVVTENDEEIRLEVTA